MMLKPKPERLSAARLPALLLILGLASPTANAASTLSPNAGPTAGGTAITVTVTAPPFTQVAAGYYGGYGLATDGSIYAWGLNGNGQLGDGTTITRTAPVQVHTPAEVMFTQVSGSQWAGFGLTSDGSVYAWGRNNVGQLGDGTTTDSTTPVKVLIPAGVTISQIAAGAANTGTTYALTSDGGSIYAWGGNNSGALGNGTTTDSSIPVLVQTPTGVTFTQIAAGWSSGYALASNGSLYAWGWNSNGQLGDGTLTDRATPVQVQIPTGVTSTQVATSYVTAYALTSDGSLYAWGYNMENQLGVGTTIAPAWRTSTPLQVLTPAGVTFTQVAAGTLAGYGLASDGSLYAWGGGLGGYGGVGGDLGDGTTDQSNIPVLAHIPAGVTITQAGGGGFHTGYALASDGSIYAWGQNESGQLGNGTITSTTPTPGLVQTPAVAVFDVSFADVAGTSLTGDSNSWNVVTPQAAPDVCGPVDVTLTYTIGAGSLFTETLPGGFTYDTPCAPTGLSAVAGNASAMAYFTAPADGGSPITGYTVTATPISGGAPVFATGTGSPILAPGLTNGETYILTVYASNANGDGLESAISNPVTPSAPPPVITEVNPSSGPTAGGTSVTITGANFTGTTEVTFGGVAALFLVSSDTSITAITPAGEAGTVDVQVTTSVSASALVPEDKFTYVSGFCDATDTIFCDGFDG